MAERLNTIIAGEYKGKDLSNINTKRIFLHTGIFKSIEFTDEIVESFEQVDKTTIDNFNDFVKRGIVGGAVAGNMGTLLGTMSSKKKEEIYTIIINFKNGKKSLAVVKRPLYAAFENLFRKDRGIRLIKCPACGKEVSNQATSCTDCGQPINVLLEFED